MNIKSKLFPVIISLILSFGVSLFGAPRAPVSSVIGKDGLSDAQINAIRAGCQKRINAFLTTGKGKALVKKPIKVNWNKRGDYTRDYNQSIVTFALKAFEMNEQLVEANAALIEMCHYHLDRPQTFFEIHSFPSVCDMLVRFCKFYGPQGTRGANRLSPEARAIILKTMWEWAKEKCTIAETEVKESQTWYLENSENHHAQHFSTAWAFAMMLKDEPEYRDLKYNDGHTPKEHYDAWTVYLREYLRQRACKGMTIEIDSPSYAAATLKAVYILNDFSDDPVLKKNAKQFLDLYWSMWAEEQIDGVHGGGKTRTYAASAMRGTDFVRRAAWYILGFGDERFVHASMIPFITSTWQPPDIVYDLAYDVNGRGEYEVLQRRMGLAVSGYSSPGQYRMKTDYGGILRYAYCTPDFVMGSLFTEARSKDDWAAISGQNRWAGVILSGNPDARVYPSAYSRRGESVYNGFWSAQSGGTLIAQKLKESRDADEWRVWFSNSGLTAPSEDGGWYFAESAGAFVGVRMVYGKASMLDENNKKLGRWLINENPFSPVIIEVARKTTKIASMDAFRKAVKALPFKLDSHVLNYTSLRGDTFAFYTDESKIPEINGKPVNYAPDKVYDSPFVQSKWNSGVVDIQKGKRKLTLNFNY